MKTPTTNEVLSKARELGYEASFEAYGYKELFTFRDAMGQEREVLGAEPAWLWLLSQELARTTEHKLVQRRKSSWDCSCGTWAMNLVDEVMVDEESIERAFRQHVAHRRLHE